jgi:hypothetical protein
LFGCGGGGGGESDTTSPTAPSVDVESDNAVFDVPDNWQTDPSVWAANQEYENQPGLATVKAEEAYARGLSRLGLKVEKHAGQTAQFGIAWERKF